MLLIMLLCILWFDNFINSERFDWGTDLNGTFKLSFCIKISFILHSTLSPANKFEFSFFNLRALKPIKINFFILINIIP